MPRFTPVALIPQIAALSFLTTQAQTPTNPVDLPQRDPTIHWPKAFDPATAPVFSHNQLLIHTDCHRVWTNLTNVTAWPTWFVLTRDVTLEHPGTLLAHDSLLRLKIFDSPITSRIDEFVPDFRLSWIPQGLDEANPAHYHTWHLVPQPAGCLVITEESGIGPNDRKSPVTGSRLMHKAHELWLDSLKWKSED